MSLQNHLDFTAAIATGYEKIAQQAQKASTSVQQAAPTIQQITEAIIANNKQLQGLDPATAGFLYQLAEVIKAAKDPKYKNDPFAQHDAAVAEQRYTELIRMFNTNFSGDNFKRLVEQALDGAIDKNQKKVAAKGGTTTSGTKLGFTLPGGQKVIIDVLNDSGGIGSFYKPGDPDLLKILTSTSTGQIKGGGG